MRFQLKAANQENGRFSRKLSAAHAMRASGVITAKGLRTNSANGVDRKPCGVIAMLSSPAVEMATNSSLTVDNDSTSGSFTLYRLREGIERFFISDINNPAATAVAQSEVWVYYDIVITDVTRYNHVPGGANVLYMDGHVEFLRYPSEGPCTVAMAMLAESF